MTNNPQIKNLDDISRLKPEEVLQIDPAKMDLGTGTQDCSLIAQTFERGAHATPTEAAVFATLNRQLENSKAFSKSVTTSLQGYLESPQNSAAESQKQAQSFATAATDGTSQANDHGKQSFNLPETKQTTLGSDFGKTLLDFAKNCIPCGLRIDAFLELHPHVDLLGSLKVDLLAKLNMLLEIGNLLNNFDMYGDLCELLNLLSFMCIPDLQRLIAMLMALLILDLPRLDGLIGLLQALIAPIFAPILMAITSLLDQFVLVVANPLECIIDAINMQLKKAGFQGQLNVPTAQITAQLTTGLGELNKMLTEAKNSITEKLNFYIDEVKALLGELGTGDISYLLASLKKLKIVRMISFIVAIIAAIIEGHAACSQTKAPEEAEIDNFFQNFLNPNSPFNLWIDDAGEIHIDDKAPSVLLNTGNVLEFEGESLIDSDLIDKIQEVNQALAKPVQAIIPCKLKIGTQDVDKVNQFITELSAL